MAREDAIVAMFCPECGKDMYRHTMAFMNRPIVGAPSKIEYDWRCNDCVYIYPEFWLKDERLNNMMALMFSYGCEKKAIKKIQKLRDKHYLEFKKSGLRFVDWYKINKDIDTIKVDLKKAEKEIKECPFKLNSTDMITIEGQTMSVADWDEKIKEAREEEINTQKLSQDGARTNEDVVVNESYSSVPKMTEKEELSSEVSPKSSSPEGNC